MRFLLLALLSFFIASPAFADCTSPAGLEGQMDYTNAGDEHVFKYCNGSDWIPWAPEHLTSIPPPSSGAPTLDSLNDVDTTGVADGNCLVYNNGTSKWEDGSCGGSETDPQVGAVTNANWCVGDGSAVQCNQSAPVVSETDPEVGTLTASKWCAANGGGAAIDCTSNAPGLPTCVDGDGLIFQGSGWTCLGDYDPDAFSFTDQAGILFNTLVASNTINITGISAGTSVSVSGQGSPQISINGGGWTTSGTISSGQTLQVRLTSAGTSGTTYSATVTVGNGNDQWNVTTCAGAVVGGYCWYASLFNKSCDYTCSGHGGCNLTGTKDYTGSSGSNVNCQTVLNALGGGSGSVTSTGGGYTVGCGYDTSDYRYRYTTTTTCSGNAGSIYRACACNQ